MITPGINPEDEAFGFAYAWVKKLASKVENLVVITINGNKVTKLLKLNKAIYSAIIKEKIDLVFCHMYPEFTILAALYAKLFKKPVATWYEHGSISIRLRLAHLLTNRIISASRQGFQLDSDKHVILGHGIDTELFKPANKLGSNLLSVSRISRSKNLTAIIDAYSKIKDSPNLVIVGSPAGQDGRLYIDEIKRQVANINMQDKIIFTGGINHKQLTEKYNSGQIFINTSHTGSIDKAGLEAISSGLLLLTTNKAFAEILGNYKSLLLAENHNLADKLAALLKLPENKKKEIASYLRQQIIDNHSADNLISRMVIEFQTLINKNLMTKK